MTPDKLGSGQNGGRSRPLQIGYKLLHYRFIDGVQGQGTEWGRMCLVSWLSMLSTALGLPSPDFASKQLSEIGLSVGLPNGR